VVQRRDGVLAEADLIAEVPQTAVVGLGQVDPLAPFVGLAMYCTPASCAASITFGGLNFCASQ